MLYLNTFLLVIFGTAILYGIREAYIRYNYVHYSVGSIVHIGYGDKGIIVEQVNDFYIVHIWMETYTEHCFIHITNTDIRPAKLTVEEFVDWLEHELL